VHTAPDHIEWFKAAPAEGEIAEKAEERTRIEVELSASAGLVVGVGPLLTDWIETRVRHGRGAEVPIHRLDPGLTSIRPGPGTPPPEAVCLVLGRAEDEVLKGIDIGAAAVAGLPPKDRPRLVVRGAPSGRADSLQVRIGSAAYGGVRVDVRRYTSDVERVEEDIRQSSLVLMPSRSEGFGVVGMEAISAGVPVLVSSESGLGRLLRELVPSLAHHFVVDVLNVCGEDAATWRKEIEFVLRDRNAAFERARQLRDTLRPVLSWERAVDSFLEQLAPVLGAARADPM
jgi:glycosyltransferase involved in cell wall biosynthesis